MYAGETARRGRGDSRIVSTRGCARPIAGEIISDGLAATMQPGIYVQVAAELT